MPALSYRELLDQYDRARAFGEQRSLKDYATGLNATTGSQDYSAGLRDGWWTRASTRLDQNLFEPIAAETTEPLFGAVGGMFGHEEAGREVGKGIPRMAAEVALSAVPAVGPALTAGAMAAHTYADTGSGPQAAISGITGLAIPGLGYVGGRLGAASMGGSKVAGEVAPEFVDMLGKSLNDIYPVTSGAAGKVAAGRFVGSQVGQIGANIGGGLWSAQQAGQLDDYDAMNAQFLMTQIPFTVLDLLHLKKAPLTAPYAEMALKKPVIPKVEAFVPPRKATAAEKANQEQLITAATAAMQDPKTAAAAVKLAADAVNGTAVAVPKVPSPIEIHGWGNPTSQGPDHWHAYVDHVEPGEHNIVPGQTVFINGVKPIEDPLTGRMIWQGSTKTVNSDIQFKLNREDFVVPENPTPEIPPRVEGVAPTSLAGVKPTEDATPGVEGVGDTLPKEESIVKLATVLRPDEQRTVVGVEPGMGLPAKVLETKVEPPHPVIAKENVTLQPVKKDNLILQGWQGRLYHDPATGTVRKVGPIDVAKDGWMDGNAFVKATGQQPLWEYYRRTYPDAFRETPTERKWTDARGEHVEKLQSRVEVNPTKLVEGLKERPMVEVRKLTNEEAGPSRQKAEEIQHELETRGYTYRPDEAGIPYWYKDGKVVREKDSPDAELFDAFNTLKYADTLGTFVGAKYGFLGPKDEKSMPGYVEILVRVPRAGQPKEVAGAAEPDKSILYRGPHFDSEDTNVLGFLRGYEETLPNGEKAFHVIEVQSDWGQVMASNREQQKQARKEGKTNPTADAKLESADHPFLSSWQDLALQAAVQHAQEIGATHVVTSLGKSAMMTEGHDTNFDQNKRYVVSWDGPDGKKETQDFRDEGAAKGTKLVLEQKGMTNVEIIENRPTQEGGMLAHYGSEDDARPNGVVPNLMRKITGYPGEVVNLGEHKNATNVVSETTEVGPNDWVQKNKDVLGSPVFKERDSTGALVPQTHIFGLSFSLDKITAGLSADQAANFREAVQKWEQMKVREKELQERQQSVPKTTEEVAERVGDGTEEVKKKVESDATAEQAVSDVDLQKGTTELDSVRAQLDKLHKSAKRLQAEQNKAANIAAGNTKFDEIVARANANPEGKDAKIVAAVQQALNKAGQSTKSGGERRTDLPDRFMIALNNWDGEDLNVLKRQLNGALRWQQVGPRGAGMKNEKGSVLMTKEEAELLHASLSDEEQKLWEPVGAGYWRAGDKKGQQKFKVQKRVTGAQTASLNTKLGEGVSEIQDTLTAPEVFAPEVSQDALVTKLDNMLKDTEGYAEEFLGTSDLSEEERESVLDDLVRARETMAHTLEVDGDDKEFLPSLNKKLEEKGLESFATKGQAQDNLRSHLATTREFHSLTLDSEMPREPELEKAVGLHRGMRSVLEYIAKNDFGFSSEMAKVYLLHPTDPDTVRLITSEHDDPRWRPSDLYYIEDPASTGGEIFLGQFPTKAELENWVGKTLHEYDHHVLRNLKHRNDPAAMEFKNVQQEILTFLRNHPKVAPEMKAFLKFADKTNLYKRIGTEGLNFGDELNKFLGKRAGYKDTEIAYGLINTDELGAQLVGSKPFQDFAKGKQMTKSGVVNSVFGWFTNAWAKLTGVSKPDVTQQYFDAYGNYFTGTLLRKSYNGREFFRAELMVRGVKANAVASQLYSLDRMFSTGELGPSITGWERERDAGMLPAGVNAGALDEPLKNVLVNGDAKAVHEAVGNLLASQVKDHRDLYWQLRKHADIVGGLVEEAKAGRVPVTLPQNIEAKLAETNAKLQAMLKGLKRQAKDIAAFGELNNFSPEGLRDLMADSLLGRRLNNSASGRTGLDEEAADTMGVAGPTESEVRRSEAEKNIQKGVVIKTKDFIWDSLALVQHFARTQPDAQPFAAALQRRQGDAFERIGYSSISYASNPDLANSTEHLDYVDKAVLKNNQTVAQTPKLKNMSNMLYLLAQEKQKAGQPFDVNSKEIDKLFRSQQINDKERAAVLQELRSHMQQQDFWTDKGTPEFFDERNAIMTAAALRAHEIGMTAEQAVSMAKQVYSALRQMQDPTQMMVGQETLRSLATQMRPETFAPILQHATAFEKSAQKVIGIMKKNGAMFSSEQRFDDYHVIMFKPGESPARLPAKNEADARKKVAEYEAKGYRLLDFIPRSDIDNAGSGLRPEMLSAFEESDRQAINAMSVVLEGADPLIRDQVLGPMQRALQYGSLTAAFNPVPGTTRRLAAGREYIDAIQNQHESIARINSWMTHQLVRADWALHSQSPGVAGNRELRTYLQTHMENFLRPDSPWATKLTKILYYQKLGFELGNALLEGVQFATTGMQALISETGSVTDAFSRMGEAIKTIGKKGLGDTWDNPDHQWLMTRASLRNDVRNLEHSDFIDPNRSAYAEISTPVGHVAKGVNLMENGAKSFTALFSRWNDRIAMLSAFDLAMERGMDRNAAYDFALDVKERGLFTGGKAQRSVGLWSINSRPVSQMLGALNTYTLGFFGQMGSDFKIGFRDAPAGTTPYQRAAAKKAVFYGLGAQLVLAGALGMPGAGQAFALLKQTTGLDLKGEARKFLANAFDEDISTGGVFSNLALRGLIAGATPLDPSSRAAISIPFTGIDAYTGFDPMKALAGAPGASASDFVKGMLMLAHGDAHGLEKMIPNVTKRPLRLWLDDGDVRDNRGTLLHELTPGERFMQGIGLPPTTLENARDTAEQVRLMKQKAAREKESLADDMAKLIDQKRYSEVQQKVIQMQQDDPTFDGKEFLKSVVARSEARNFEYDWRRDVNPALQLGIPQRMPSSELARRKYREATAAALGIPQAPNLQSDARAATLDQLLNANPYLSPSDAKRATRMRPAPSPYTVPMPAGYQ